MTYEICSRTYPVIGHVNTRQTGRVPVVDLPMMTGERLNELAQKSDSAPVGTEDGRTNDEKFNALLNSCQNPRAVYNALAAFARAREETE